MDIQSKIFAILDNANIDYTISDHEQSQTCEESALARGESISIGGKSILFKDKSDYRIFTLSADREVDSNKVRKILSSQRLRFAREDELKELCHVVKGALPPIIKDIYPFDHFLDKSIIDNEKIAFNAGILTKSVIMKTSDYLTLINATICEFSK